jgi:glyoxylase-like metal-dependent hydrolase (beta-lactamase superfamily II)
LRVVGVHEDVIVATSRVWQTNCVALRSGRESLMIDSPVFPDELEALPQVLAQAGFEVSGVLATHADWDHLLGRLAFPGAALGVAETTAARLRAESGGAQRELRAFDESHYVERSSPLGLGDWQVLPVPGKLEVGGSELELHPADGHTEDGMAVWVPDARLLICGDYLSPVEIPLIAAGGSLDGYEATLGRLAPLVERAEAVVPGHGAVLARERALSVLREDLAYVRDLRARGAAAQLPPDRRSAEQRRIHSENAGRHAA